GTIDGAPRTQTPSRAEHGPGGRLAFRWIHNILLRDTPEHPLTQSGILTATSGTDEKQRGG
ncbi:MAG: hypothetical protein ACE10C_11150, partial [Candidatus Binatia bacterium]